MRKSDIRSVTVYDIEIYGQRILTAQIERVQYKIKYKCVNHFFLNLYHSYPLIYLFIYLVMYVFIKSRIFGICHYNSLDENHPILNTDWKILINHLKVKEKTG